GGQRPGGALGHATADPWHELCPGIAGHRPLYRGVGGVSGLPGASGDGAHRGALLSPVAGAGGLPAPALAAGMARWGGSAAGPPVRARPGQRPGPAAPGVLLWRQLSLLVVNLPAG